MAEKMTRLTGGCLCGAIRYEIAGDIQMRAMCLCRTCQKISGGGGNLFIGLLASDFRYTAGTPSLYSRDPHTAPTREFCSECGVHLAGRSPKAPGGLVVKVGTLDDPAVFVGPNMVFWSEHGHDFHQLPEGAKIFPRHPTRQ